MKCEKPYIRGTQVFGCGSCVPCLIDRRRIWTHRLMLEAMLQSDNCFVTLTYEDKNLPEIVARDTGELLGTLRPLDLELWLKRFRQSIAPQKVRFYGVGEYGETSERPHYHLCLFGYAGCAYGVSTYNQGRKSCCVQCDRVRDTWGKGIIELGELNQKSAQYCAGYVVKKMTRTDDIRLRGRWPEFSRQSRRPGIAAGVIGDIAKVIAEYELLGDDVPSQLRHGKKMWPLGRYLMRKLRKELGREEGAPQAVIDKIAEQLRPMFEAAKASSEVPSAKAHIVKSGEVKRMQINARRAIFEPRKGGL